MFWVHTLHFSQILTICYCMLLHVLKAWVALLLWLSWSFLKLEGQDYLFGYFCLLKAVLPMVAVVEGLVCPLTGNNILFLPSSFWCYLQINSGWLDGWSGKSFLAQREVHWNCDPRLFLLQKGVLLQLHILTECQQWHLSWRLELPSLWLLDVYPLAELIVII